MSIHGKNFIGNKLLAESRVTFQAVDPSNGKELEGIFYEATPGEVAGALQLAGRVFSIYRNKHPYHGNTCNSYVYVAQRG